MADKKLNIKVGLKGAKKAEKGLGKVNNSMKSMAKTAVAAGAAFFGARAIISGLSAVIRLAGEQEQAEKKLEVALGRTSQALLNQATALQKVTTFGDEAIIGVQASLAAFLDSEDAIKKATEATLDISVAMGMDLKSAGDLVAKTLGSSTNAMSRYGIQVEGAVGSTERLESLTGNVAKLFGGQAKAQAETMSGQIDQMKNAVGDTAEAFGSLLAPVVIKVSGVLKTVAENLSGIAGAIAEDLPEAVLKAAEAFKEQSRAVIGSQEHLAQSTKIMSDLKLEFIAASGKSKEFAEAIAIASNRSQSLNEARKKMQLLVKHGIAQVVDAVSNEQLMEEARAAAIQKYTAEQMLVYNNLVAEKALRQQFIASHKDEALALGLITEEQHKQIKFWEDIEGIENAFTGAKDSAKELLDVFNNLSDVEIDAFEDLLEELGYDSVYEAFGLPEPSEVETAFKEQIELAGALSSALQTAFDPNLGAGEAFKGFVIQLMSAMQGVILASGEVSKALTFTFAGPIGVGASVAALIGLEAAKAGVRGLKFAQGGIVPGQGTGDTVPAMLTPGEVILNKAQQENLVGGMGVTINIQGGIVQEDYVVNELLPAINKAKALA